MIHAWRRTGRPITTIGCAVVLALACLPVAWAAEEPDSSAASKKTQQPEPSSTTAQPPRLTPLAQQYIEQAKAKLAAEQARKQAQAAPRRSAAAPAKRGSEQAQRLAGEFAREKAKRQASTPQDTEEQLHAAREHQLKASYQRALALYRQGAYAESIELLQKLTLLEPGHPLINSAQHLITRAELKLLEQRARASAGPVGARDAMVSELTRRLTEKRIEQETVIKYARAAMQERNYDMAIELLYRVLQQDPDHRQAQQLLQQAQAGKFKDHEHKLAQRIKLDEQQMLNDVLRAEVVPPDALGYSGTSLRPISSAAQWSSKSQVEMVAKLIEPVSFDFQEVALSDVLDFFGDAANVSIIPSPYVDLKQRKVTMKANQLPLEVALKYLMKNQSLSYRIEDGVVLIASPEEFANEPLETRVLYLRAGLSPFVLETSAVQSNPVLATETLKGLIDQSVTQPSGSKLVIDERTGSLIVTNTAENIRKIETLLASLDIAPTQVLIEARFIEVVQSELEHLGFESVLNGDFSLDKKTESNGTRGPGQQITRGSGSKFATLSRESEGLNFTLQGILTGTQFESVLHLLEETQRSKTLSAPRVTTLNNQTASIKVVDEFRYPTRYEVSLVQFDVNGDGDFDDAGETEFVNVPKDFQKRDVGILLNVTPSVGKDARSITLVLAPEVSQFSQFRDLGGGVSVPEFTSSQLTTSVVMSNGQTVVLGGLMKDIVSSTNTKVPVLGDLPVVGGLFRQREASQTLKNLLIFVTARVLAPRGPTT